MDGTQTERWAQGWLWERAEQVAQQALATGALQPIHTLITHLPAGAAEFLVHQLDGDGGARALDKKLTRSPFADNHDYRAFNPFLPYEPALFVADIAPTHLALLNKYPVMRQHLLVVTRAFEEQDAALTLADFAALWTCMGVGGTLGFYNGGKVAGASQRHKHLQVVPLPLDPTGVAVPSEALLGPPQEPGRLCTAAALPFRHALVWFDPAALVADPGAPAYLLDAYRALLTACAAWDGDRPRPYNLLLTHRWMLLALRSQERCDGIGVNGLGFAGSLLVRNAAELAHLRRLGPLEVLRRVCSATDLEGKVGIDRG